MRGITIEEIEEKFGKRVRELVEAETENKRENLPPAESWRIRKEESLEVLKNTDDIAVLMVWLGDKLANMRSIYRDYKARAKRCGSVSIKRMQGRRRGTIVP